MAVRLSPLTEHFLLCDLGSLDTALLFPRAHHVSPCHQACSVPVHPPHGCNHCFSVLILSLPHFPSFGSSLSPHFNMVFNDFSCSGCSLWPVSSLPLLHPHLGEQLHLSSHHFTNIHASKTWLMLLILLETSSLPLLFSPFSILHIFTHLHLFFEVFFKNTQNKSMDCFSTIYYYSTFFVLSYLPLWNVFNLDIHSLSCELCTYFCSPAFQQSACI